MSVQVVDLGQNFPEAKEAGCCKDDVTFLQVL
jgi:hypothetical protein